MLYFLLDVGKASPNSLLAVLYSYLGGRPKSQAKLWHTLGHDGSCCQSRWVGLGGRGGTFAQSQPTFSSSSSRR